MKARAGLGDPNREQKNRRALLVPGGKIFTQFFLAMAGLVMLIACGIALVACYLPARKSTRIDPAVALRQE